ncbi:MAG: hypothetical protein AAGL89_12875, partial [Pseudomonadota bacterium]
GEISCELSNEAPDQALRSEQSALVDDPFEINKRFPDRWKAYLRANFASARQIEVAFGVSNRTARNWINGTNGVNGGYVAIAVSRDPEAAVQMLFAAE